MTLGYNDARLPECPVLVGQKFYERETTVGYKRGVHAVPSAEIFSYLEDHRKAGGGEIFLIHDSKLIETNSICSILGAGIPQGAKVIIRAFGEGRMIVANGLAELISNGVGIWND